MADLIERQAAIDALAIGEELLKRVLDDVDVVGNEREKYEWGLGLIEAYIADMKDLQSAQPETPCYLGSPCEYQNKDIKLPSAQPHWIPFSEMMPAFGESVLVQFDDDDMDILTFPNIYKRLKRVAWMPLPESYRGESE